MELYHNPRCGKSRTALALLKEKGFEPTIREYLKNPPSQEELREIIQMLAIPAIELLRTNETLYKEVYKGKKLNDAEWIKVMSENPILIERPIFIHKGKAVIGRPPEEVLKLV